MASFQSEYCEEHKLKLNLFCVPHDCPCCRLCLTLRHMNCKNVTDIERITHNVKHSDKFKETEYFITEILGTIEDIRKNRSENVSSVQTQRKHIEKEIPTLRIKINNYLDQLEETFINELADVESKAQKEKTEILKSLISQEKQLIDFQTTMSTIKQFATDLQTFISLQEIERAVFAIDKAIQKLIETDKMNNITLSCEIDTTIKQFQTNIPALGKIIVKNQPCEISIPRRKNTQAQIMIPATPSTSFKNIALKLQQTINTQLKNTTGCVLLPDSRMMFSCYIEKRVKSINKDGTQDFDTGKLKPGTFDITYIEDGNNIAVTSCWNDPPCIRIMDMGSGQIKKTILVKSWCFGIVYRKNTLIYCAANSGLHMINLNDESESDVLVGNMSAWSYVATYRDKLYYTNCYTDTVTCCDLHGNIQWHYKDESILSRPFGITVDHEGNVYVVGYWTNNVVVISSDGRHGRQLLGKEDGLDCPRVLHYNRSTNRLLVTNKENAAFLLEVLPSR